MSSTRSLTRISKRVNKFKGSLYESDQEDNLKDQDYNPNEFLQNISEVKPFTTRRTSPRSVQVEQYYYNDDSDREYEFEEDDEEYFPEQYVTPSSFTSKTLKNLKIDTVCQKHRMTTRSCRR
jgi:hypothetical protein